MNRRLRALLLMSLGASLGCEATQPRPICSVYRQPFAARYTLQSMQGCAADQILPSEELEVEAYVPAPPARPDQRPSSFAVQPESVVAALGAFDSALLPEPGAATDHYSLGVFTSVRPDSSDFCHVDRLNDTRLSWPVQASAAIPAADLTYHWENVTVLVTPPSNGVYFGADLTVTSGGCVARYQVSAVSPVRACGSTKDDEGHATRDGDPDPSQCVAEPDLTTGYDGSGINTDIRVACDAHIKECVPADDFPTLTPPGR